MSLETQARLPVIDFSKQQLQPGSPVWDSVKVQVREALEQHGCFEALLDRVMELRTPIFRALEELFDLPLQTKKMCVSEKHFRGYYGPTARLHESMSVDDAHVAGNIEQCLTNFLWPQGHISFSKTLLSFTQLALGLEKTIQRMVLESFGLEKYIDELIDSTNYQLRVLKYGRPQANSEPTLGAHAHYDQNMMTLLYQNEVDGLEIRNKNGEWINVQLSPNSFIVMIGQSFNIWLNGRLCSPYHRVVTKGNAVRYSIGLFALPRGSCRVNAPEELVDGEVGFLFKPFDYEEFLEFYSTQIARGAVEYDLKAYCSV
ncbi:hypothetical protein like AT1G52820 [Hibiscus trionum]|uniref:Fe2OG dioxygenase domain-containing protein n=1 Tax=Hibiscus trionum TaxID=183268 RepID=A0A9W7J2H3_HIBTR|nr:hypothetical protein like AT1G52820 [Hibiscus trionum]